MQPEATQQMDDVAESFSEILASRRSTILNVTEIGDTKLDFARSVATGLARIPRRLECRFLYDARGSELYEQICDQPEYYPTRTEASILQRYAAEIRGLTGPATLVELGSGSSSKTDYLLGAYEDPDGRERYIPVDVSRSALELATGTIARDRPGVQVVGVNGVYEDALPLLPLLSPAVLIFLGSTIGNLDEDEAARFWELVGSCLGERDYMLLGIDLVKDRTMLEAAYDDAAGVTRAFTRNYFERMNRELGADLDLDGIEHQAVYNGEADQIEIYARFKRRQVVEVQPLGTRFKIAAGEKVLVEISRKFRVAEVRRYLAGLGLGVVRVFTDDRDWFALLLLRKAGHGAS